MAVNEAGVGGSYVPTDKQLTTEATIFIVHQQSASHIKGVLFSVHLRPSNSTFLGAEKSPLTKNRTIQKTETC